MEFRSRSVFLALVLLACALAPQALFAAEEGGSKWGPWLLAGRFFNLAVIVAVLVWVARKPLRNFYASRTQAIREQLDEAQKARIEAEAKLAEMESRMSRLDDELRELKAAAEQDARQEYDRLVQAAEKDAERIIERARMEIDGMTRAARMELKAHVAELSVGMAEEKIRSEITDEDRSRLFEQFVRRVGGPQ